MAAGPTSEARIALVAIEGRDAGCRYFVRGSEISLGRGAYDPDEHSAVRLIDSTVSSQQAILRASGDGAVIEHCEGATNPTLVNGERIREHRLATGDHIRIGAAVLEVTSVGKTASRDSLTAETRKHPQLGEDTAETIVRPLEVPWGRLVMLRGVPDDVARYFVLQGTTISIGRNQSEDLHIPHPSVSRTHAQLERDSGGVYLEPRSATNPTYVNGVAVEKRRALIGGEEVQLADQVAFRIELLGAANAVLEDIGQLEELGLISLVERKLERELELERELQARFGATGSFLDIDVVDSYGMKTDARRRDHIITSFNRFRDFATEVVEEHFGQVLNSNGDELMCFFESELACVNAACALIERLPDFNRERNLLERPFRVRQGAHTGESLVDRERGVAYSPTLDIAGHLQKQGDVDGLMISEDTRKALPDEMPFEPAGTMERQGIPMYRLKGPLGG